MSYTTDIHRPLAGMQDLFGIELRQRLIVEHTLSHVARQYGYEQIELPLVERATSFAEEIVGSSPWPEWDARGCFYMASHDYKESYEKDPETTEALLIPEGTISVTRWLGSLLQENPDFVFPLKLFYNTPCFRNELLSTLETGKGRQFNQFGIEILGAPEGAADAEAVTLIVYSLMSLGVDKAAIRVRVGDVGVFQRAAEISGLDASATIALKELLDAVAECNAGKKTYRLPDLLTAIDRLLTICEVSSQYASVWQKLARTDNTAGVISQFDDVYIDRRVGELNQVMILLNRLGMQAHLDLCVVRSHEYYTGIAFEIDVITPEHKFIEVGGGGRYDKLVQYFTPNTPHRTVPSTGFAFGVERLVELCEHLELFDRNRTYRTVLHLRDAAELLIVPSGGISGYAGALEIAHEEHAGDSSTDIYVGDPQHTEQYRASRKIPSVHILSEKDER